MYEPFHNVSRSNNLSLVHSRAERDSGSLYHDKPAIHTKYDTWEGLSSTSTLDILKEDRILGEDIPPAEVVNQRIGAQCPRWRGTIIKTCKTRK